MDNILTDTQAATYSTNTSATQAATQTASQTNDTTAPATAKEIVEQHNAALANLANDQVSISPRAEKIQKLNEEFFPSGAQSVKITPDFIQRLNDYELISDSDAQKFLQQLDEKPSGTSNTLGQIMTFIEQFQTELETVDENHPLLGPLNDALNIVRDMADGKASYSADEIGSTMNSLKEFSASDAGIALSGDHQDTLQEVHDILGIIQSFNSDKLSNPATQQYSAIFSQGS